LKSEKKQQHDLKTFNSFVAVKAI